MGDSCFIYGAIFKYAPPEGACRHHLAPRYIVAFPGTVLTDPCTAACDLYLDGNVVFNTQHGCQRFSHAREWVQQLLLDNNIADASDVWLAGHSLGASIALDMGHDLAARDGRRLPTFLFNPPHVSLAPAADMLGMAEVAKRHLYVISSLFKYALGKTVIRPHMEHMGALFEQLSLWVPELFVHQQDMICTGFIDYFVQRQQLQKRFPGMARTAATLAFRDLLHLSSVSGVRHKERRQLLPSARLWVNSSEVGCLRVHELQQWCQPKLMLRSNLYN
jgi:pimeloyl-ACP methyl ester carboxylesterase